MENPWIALPTHPPYVLPQDAAVINGRPDIRLDLLPVPYLGSPNRAVLYVLALNPGVLSGEAELLEQNPYYVQQCRRGLTFSSAYPFRSFDPALAGTPGHTYWKKCLAKLGAVLGEDFLRERVMCVEFFPYRSWRWVGLPRLVTSQHYSFELVRQAAAKRLPIVLMRGRTRWFANVPELASAGCYALKSRNCSISPGNMVEGEFDRLIERLAQL